jgi:hypothetical protein
MELRIREVDEGGGGLTETRASEAKGPFPGGKRVGSRGKKENVKERKRKREIGVGRDGLFVSPSLRTGLADLPHPALQLMVLPQRGLTSNFMGG